MTSSRRCDDSCRCRRAAVHGTTAAEHLISAAAAVTEASLPTAATHATAATVRYPITPALDVAVRHVIAADDDVTRPTVHRRRRRTAFTSNQVN